MNLTAFGQIGLDPPKVGFIMFFAIAEPSIDRKLAHFEALIKQKLAKFGCFPRAFLRVHGQVEHDEYPHQPVSAQVHGSIAAGCPSDAQSRVSGGSNRASVGLRSSNLRASDWARRWAAMDPGETAPPSRQSWPRSDEHPSELQPLMRTSYAVFCL